MGNRRESLQNQGAFEPKTNVFDFRGLFFVETRPTECIVQETDQVADIILQTCALLAWPMEKVENFQIETQTITFHDDIVGVEIAMIFPGLVDALQSDDERI